MKKKDYNRPNQEWECGWAKDGKACPRGPSPDGHCHTTQECEPGKQGDRHICSRLASRGGKCDAGPLADGSCSLKIPPCIPVRSIRAKRGLVSFYVFAASVGIALVALGTKASSNHFFSPGPLSNHHRSIKHDCNTCHGGAKDSIPAQWLVKAHDPHLISNNCQACHSLSEHPNDPHGMKPEELEAITKAKLGPERAKDFHAANRQLECTTCHTEHHGVDSKVTTITSQQCQSCHVQNFRSLASGHPDFKAYPFERRTRILFDHGSHFSKYFPDKKRTDISCNQCHMPEQKGQHMVMRGFEKSCAECHEPAIRGVDQVVKGIVFWRFPAIDLKALKQAGVGSWPEDADGKLTPYQKLLFAGDDRFAEALKNVAELDLSDLSSATPEQVKSVARLAWGVKAMMHELSKEGGPYLKERLEKSLGTKISDEQISMLLGSLPIDMLRSAGKAWFRNLEGDLAAWAAKTPRATEPFKLVEGGDEKDEAWTEAGGGWYRKTSDFTIRLRPRGHADAFVHSWIDLLAASPSKEKLVTSAFDGLVDPKAPGTCVKCHSVDQAADGSVSMNWHGKNRENSPQTFVAFRHSAHFSLLDEKGCMTCHAMNPKSDYDKNFEGRDPHNFASSFSPIDKATCITCHSGDRVDQNCQSCHNYHVEGEKGRSNAFSKIKTKL